MIAERIKAIPEKLGKWLAKMPENQIVYFHMIEPSGATNYVGEIDAHIWRDPGARACIAKIMAESSFHPGWISDGDVFPEDVPFLEFLLGNYDEVLTERVRKSRSKKPKRGRSGH